ncbi:MAG TPA: amidohydrolase family protein [Candidatus Binataceae bacterium]|nr:amidohydrolase family protein [Candidatus Binataceae bacterium]
MNSTPAIDIHAHAIVPEVEMLARRHPGWQADLDQRQRSAGAASAEHNRKLTETVYREKFESLEARLATMDTMGIDIQTVSAAPTSNFWYWADPELAAKLVAINNQEIAQLCQRRPDRLVGLGVVALQHPELAAAQLKHAVAELGLRGAIIATHANGMDLGDPSLAPFWQAAQATGALIFIHPAGCELGTRLTRYYFSNVIGNPLETTLALGHLIFSGTLDHYPGLKICAAHGGGYFPFYTARFDHGWRVRPEAHGCRRTPSAYLRNLWFDSLVYEPDLLSFLIARAGAGQIVLGTDYPFDMGVDDPRQRLAAVSGLSQAQQRAIVGENAARLLGL